MHGRQLLNTQDDVRWVKETHLKSWDVGVVYPCVGAVVIEGNEDCPTRIELYESDDPRWDEKPLVVFCLESEGYMPSKDD